jgi:hypothetical protein
MKMLKALCRQLHDDSLRETMGHNGAEKVHAEYRFNAFRSNLEQIIETFRRRRLGLKSADLFSTSLTGFLQLDSLAFWSVVARQSSGGN